MAIETREVSGAPDLPDDRLVALLAGMTTARRLDERFTQLQRQGTIPCYLPCYGYEAVGAAIAHVMTAQDWLFPSFRDLAAAVCRGVPLATIAHQVFGTSEAPSKGRVLPIYQIHRDYNIASSSAGGAAHLVHAAGVAWAAKLRKDPVVALASFAGGAVASGEFHAALNFAAVFSAPVVFVCQNSEAEAACEFAAGYGIAGAQVDGSDVLALVGTLEVAMERARSGHGSTLVEARISAHSRPDPVALLRRRLQERGIRPDVDTGALEAEIQAALEEAGRTSPPELQTLFADVFSSSPIAPRTES